MPYLYTMNKSTLQDALACFERFGINAEVYSDGTIMVETSMPDVFVEISQAEVILRADQFLEIQRQDVDVTL